MTDATTLCPDTVSAQLDAKLREMDDLHKGLTRSLAVQRLVPDAFKDAGRVHSFVTAKADHVLFVLMDSKLGKLGEWDVREIPTALKPTTATRAKILRDRPDLKGKF